MATNITTEEGVLGAGLVAFSGMYYSTGSMTLAIVAALGAAGAALVALGHYLPPGQ